MNIKYIVWLVALLGIWWFLFFYDSKDASGAAAPITPENLISTIYSTTPAARWKNEILKWFCDSVMWTSISSWFVNKWFAYIPSKSVFLYMTCQDVGKYKWSNEFWWTYNILKYANLSKIENKTIKNMHKSVCDPKTRMYNCNFGLYYNLIYSMIMDDYANIKLANSYGYINSKNIKDNVNSFVIKNFGSEDICGDDKILYLNKTRVWWNDAAACSHPKTYKLLSSYIEQIAKNLEKSGIINYDGIILHQKACDKVKNISEEMITCRLVSTWVRFDQDNNLSFANVIQNEYFWYWLLNQYANENISYDMVGDSAGNDVEKAKLIAYREKYGINFYTILAKKSTDKTTSVLYQTITKFPVHIAMVAYHEDVTEFRNKMAELYTPIKQLQYKMQNVQDKNS